MDIAELLDAAKRKKGTFGELAAELGCHQNRFSEWRKGTRKPDAHEIAYLAKAAGLPVLQTVAEIESQLDERFSSIWSEALGKLTAAGVAASVAALVLMGTPTPANADQSVYYVNRRKRKRVRFSDPRTRGIHAAFC